MDKYFEIVMTDHGRGLQATKDISAGTVITVVPGIILKRTDLTENSTLNDYIFYRDRNSTLLALGYGSLFNHSEDSNVDYEVNDDHIKFTVSKDVTKGTELLINYGYDPNVSEYAEDRNLEMKEKELVNYFSNIKSNLDDAPDNIKRDFNKVLKYFSSNDINI